MRTWSRATQRPRLPDIAAWPVFPLLLALAFILEPFTRYNVDPIRDARLFALAGLASAGVTAVAWLLVGRERAGMLGALILMALVAATTPARVLIYGLAIAMLLAETALVRRAWMQARLPWRSVTGVLNLATGVMLAVTIGQALALSASTPAIEVPSAWTSWSGTASHPNVYVLLVDGHARRDVLRQRFDYAMEPLAGTLERLGFRRGAAEHYEPRLHEIRPPGSAQWTTAVRTRAGHGRPRGRSASVPRTESASGLRCCTGGRVRGGDADLRLRPRPDPRRRCRD